MRGHSTRRYCWRRRNSAQSTSEVFDLRPTRLGVFRYPLRLSFMFRRLGLQPHSGGLVCIRPAVYGWWTSHLSPSQAAFSGLLGFGFSQTGSRRTAWAEAVRNEGPSKGPGSFLLGVVPGVERLAYRQPKARQTGLKHQDPSSLSPILGAVWCQMSEPGLLEPYATSPPGHFKT